MIGSTKSAVGAEVRKIKVGDLVVVPFAVLTFFNNVTISGGPAPARAYIEELLPDVLEGLIEPGKVFDFVGDLEKVPAGYRAMNAREVTKAMIEF